MVTLAHEKEKKAGNKQQMKASQRFIPYVLENQTEFPLIFQVSVKGPCIFFYYYYLVIVWLFYSLMKNSVYSLKAKHQFLLISLM